MKNMKPTFKKCLNILVLCLISMHSLKAQWTDNQAADAVYGQTDFTSMTTGRYDNNNLVRPVSVAFTKHNKKVIIGAVNLLNGVTSELFFYNDYTDPNNAKLALSFKLELPTVPSPNICTVNSVFVDEDDNLWVATNGNTDNNLYKYSNASSLTSTSTPTATFKLRQYASNTTYPSFKGSVFVKSGVLVIADATNHVVARYNANNLTTSGTIYPAAYIGKLNSSGTPVAGAYEANPSTLLLREPVQVNLDKNNALWIADKGNARVLKINDGLAFNNGSLPNLTIGRNTFTEPSVGNNPANNFDNLTGIATDGGGRLYVASARNNSGSKIHIYNTNNITSNLNANATNVIGHDVINLTYPNHTGTSLTDNKLYNTSNIAVNDHLWVTDYTWNRVLRFSPSSTLPVTLTELKATKINGVVKLSWKTSSETNSSHFVVEKSTNGINFSFLKQITAKSSNGAPYELNDTKPANGTNYYRLIQVDNDGIRNDLGTKSVNFNFNSDKPFVYPNPVKTTTSISFIAGKFSHGELYDINGKKIAKFDIQHHQSHIKIDLFNYLKGVYLVKLTGSIETETIKLIKE